MSFCDLLDDYVHDRPHHVDQTHAGDQGGLANAYYRFDPEMVIDLDEDKKFTRCTTSSSPSPLSSSSPFFLVP